MRAKCIKVYLNPQKENDQRVLGYLQSSESSNSRAIIQAVIAHLDREEILDEKLRFFQEVRETIRDCMGDTELPQPADSQGNEDSAFEFLDALGV